MAEVEVPPPLEVDEDVAEQQHQQPPVSALQEVAAEQQPQGEGCVPDLDADLEHILVADGFEHGYALVPTYVADTPCLDVGSLDMDIIAGGFMALPDASQDSLIEDGSDHLFSFQFVVSH